MSSAADRVAAARTLGRVVRHGAWTNVTARVESQKGADLATVQSLVMGSLRHIPLLDRSIEQAARRSTHDIDPAVLDLLRIGAHELQSETERPVPVVVDTVVTATGTAFPRARGFVNAVMRRLSEMDIHAVSPEDLGFPPWLIDRLTRSLGDEVAAFVAASQEPPSVGLRSTTTVSRARSVPGIANAWLWSDGPPPTVPGVSIQDPASVAVGDAMAADPGHRALDIAAAPGGKTSHLLDQVGESGLVVAMDAHPRRVESARRRVRGAAWLVGDGTAPPFAPASFDRVLLDAPCTGLGTLRRRPEIRYRVTEAEIERLARLQRDMLEASLGLVGPGGRLVFSVCTVTPDETIDVVSGLGGRPPEGLPGVPLGDGLLLGPHLGPTDGMFICVFDV